MRCLIHRATFCINMSMIANTLAPVFRRRQEKTRCQVVEPVLPMDILGTYLILPEVKP